MRDTHATWLLNMDVKVELILGTTSRRKQEGYALGVGWMEPRMFFEHYARIMRRKKEAEVLKARRGVQKRACACKINLINKARVCPLNLIFYMTQSHLAWTACALIIIQRPTILGMSLRVVL